MIDIVRDIGKIKLQLDLPIKDERVEQAKLKRLTDLAQELNISTDLINTIYLLVINYGILLQKKDRKTDNLQLDWTSTPNNILSEKTALSMGSDTS